MTGLSLAKVVLLLVNFVIRNSDGDPLLTGARSLGHNTSILHAEAWSLKEGIIAALSLNISKLVVEGNNLTVINFVCNIWKVPWEIKNIIFDINALLLNFDVCQVQHCFREANKVADAMAHRGYTFSDLQLFTPPFDVDFSLLVRKDVLGWTSI